MKKINMHKKARTFIVDAYHSLPRSHGAKKAARPDISIRKYADAIGRRAALNVDSYWSRASASPDACINVIDMFSGCGGMSTGFSLLNRIAPIFRLAGAVDIDAVANRTYSRNLFVEPYGEDISGLARKAARLKDLAKVSNCGRSNPLVLIGCAPCQGFSSHRNSHGEQDERNSLFVDFARIATILGPDAVLVENVPELLTDRYWAVLIRARRMLEDAGYFVHLGVHNMAAFGVPQERFRALMVAMKRPFSSPRPFLARPHFKTVRDAIGHLPSVKAGARHASDPLHYSAGHKQSTLQTIQAVPKDGGNRPEHVGPACLRRAKHANGKAAYEDVYGRLYWDRPSITITAYARNPASGRFVHPDQNRGLTVREAALLQGFPHQYWFDGSLDERFRQIGNAVPPPFSAYLAGYVAGELLDEPVSKNEFSRGIEKPVGSSFSRLIPGLKSEAADLSLVSRNGSERVRK